MKLVSGVRGALLALLVSCSPATLFHEFAVADEFDSSRRLRNIAALDASVRERVALELHRLSPYVEQRAFPYVRPVVGELHRRFQAVERVARSRQMPVRHLAQFVYGSTFLSQNPVANDLDYMLGVHLGTIRLAAGRSGPVAEEVITRMEEYLQVAARVFDHYSTAQLSLWDSSVLEEGRLRRRDEALQLLSNSLKDVLRGREQRLLLIREDGLGVPNVLSPRESYIRATTRMQFLSNSIRSVDWMFVGIRRVQVMFHFAFRLEISRDSARPLVMENFPVHPTFIPSGRVLRMEGTFLGMVPVDRPSGGLFSETVLASPQRMAEIRLDTARQLLVDVRFNLESGDTTKALKRLQQVQSALTPGLDPSFSRRLSEVVAGYLKDPGVVGCNEVAEMAKSVRIVLGKRRLIGFYSESGDLDRALKRLVRNLRSLPRRHAGFGSAQTETLLRGVLDLINQSSRGQFAPSNRGTETLLETLEGWGETCGLVLAPPVRTVELAREKVLAVLRDSGVRSLPIYGLSDGTIGIPVRDLARVGLRGDIRKHIIAAGGPDMPYRVIEDEDLPLGSEGESLPVSDRLWLAPRDSGPEWERWLRLRALLRDDGSNFRRVRWDDAARLRPWGLRRLRERFGERAVLAWNRTTTAGNGLLALLGTELGIAEVLFDTHLTMIGEIGSAVAAIPLGEDGEKGYRIALERALRTTSERILEGLAVGRASKGRSGLTTSEAKRAQAQLRSLLAVLDYWAGGKAPARNLGRGEFELRTRSGKVKVAVSSWESSAVPRGVGIDVSTGGGGRSRAGLSLRLSRLPGNGTVWDLEFSPDRMNWGVHGASPVDPMKPDQSFFDGFPVAATSIDDGGPRPAGAAFTRYLEERLLPAIEGQQ